MSDFRVQTSFFIHPKTVKLTRRAGAEGVVALMRLWAFCVDNRPGGDLSGLSDEEVEIAAGWDGGAGELVAVLLDLRFIDGECEGGRRIHDWAENQPWASEKPRRTAASKRAINIRWHKMGKHEGALAEHCPMCFPDAADTADDTPDETDHTERNTDGKDAYYGKDEPVIPLSSPFLSSPFLSNKEELLGQIGSDPPPPVADEEKPKSAAKPYNHENEWHEDILELCTWFYQQPARESPTGKVEKLKLMDSIRLIFSKDMSETPSGDRPARLRKVLEGGLNDEFWNSQLISLGGLRKKKENGRMKWRNCETGLGDSSGGDDPLGIR
jgi:hypothetical protein